MFPRRLFWIAVLSLPCLAALVMEHPTAARQVRPEEQPARQVFLGGGLSDEQLLQLTAAVAASSRPGRVVLLDSPTASKANQAFVAAFKPAEIIPVGSFPQGVADLEKRLGCKPAGVLEWRRGPPTTLWKQLFPQAAQVVVCPPESRRLLLHSACLAGVLRAPLFVLRGEPADKEELSRCLSDWKTQEVHAVGRAFLLCRELLAAPGLEFRLHPLADEAAVGRVSRTTQAKNGPVRTVVVANPADADSERGKMSLLAPWLAAQKRGALVLTGDKGTDTATAVGAVLDKSTLRHADTVVLAASLKAIPTEKRPNPVEGKDAEIEMEPLTPRGEEAFSFATGRLFHQDPALVLVQQARQHLLPADFKARRALVVSNPGGGLPLLETFSRHTTNELRNAGYQTTAMFAGDADKDRMRKLMPQQDVLLWEGHYRTLIDDYGFLTWTEPLPPALYFLQSCLALKEEETSLLLQRGALAFVGSSTRTYSATGGAFTLAFFDAVLYDDQTLGGALRQAKNYLLCYSQLKEKRLGEKAKLTGVNVRSAWAFTLWGDPELKLPRPERLAKDKELPGVRHEVRANTIILTLPETAYETVKVGKYEANMRPNARLAGLLTMSAENEDLKSLVPFVFAEVPLPKAPTGKKPKLDSKLTDKAYQFVWDERRKTGYLLVTPRRKDQRELRFRVEWVD